MLGSSTYKYSLKQITLSQESMKYILDYIDDPSFNKHIMVNIDHQDEKKCLLSVYDEILDKMDKYLPLFDINGFRKKLHDGREKFVKLPVEKQAEVVKDILRGLHANSEMTKPSDLGLTTALGFMQASDGIKISDDAVFIYQSPTGLFERRVKVSDLLK